MVHAWEHAGWPSEVRAEVLTAHEGLRELIADLRAEIAEGSPELADDAAWLVELLLEHLAVEEELLAPLLPTLDAWGAVRAERLRAEHARQRERIVVLARRLDWRGDADLGEELLAFLDDLGRDLRDEEQECLGAELLRDDATGIDVISG